MSTMWPRIYQLEKEKFIVNTIELINRRVADALRQGQYVVIDDDRTYLVSHVMILLGPLSKHLVWVADPMIGLPAIRTYRRVVKSATMAFAVAAQAGGKWV